MRLPQAQLGQDHASHGSVVIRQHSEPPGKDDFRRNALFYIIRVTSSCKTFQERELLAVVYCFHTADFLNEKLARVLSKYIKIRGVRIQEKDLMATICDLCLEFRFRDAQILDGVAQYVIEHGKSKA